MNRNFDTRHTDQLQVGDYVTVKVRGYPLWPAIIFTINSTHFTLYFYGTEETHMIAIPDLPVYNLRRATREVFAEAVDGIKGVAFTVDAAWGTSSKENRTQN